MSSLSEKIIASWVNIAVVMALSPLIYAVTNLYWWKIDTIALFAAYNIAFIGQRDIGMRCAGTWYLEGSEQRFLGVALYTLSFASLFYWIWFPADLFLLNGLVQAICLVATGNTLHGWLSRTITLNEVGHLTRNMDTSNDP